MFDTSLRLKEFFTLDLGDTLLMLIQQQNQKEEQMLYPMAERALDTDWTEILERLTEY